MPDGRFRRRHAPVRRGIAPVPPPLRIRSDGIRNIPYSNRRTGACYAAPAQTPLCLAPPLSAAEAFADTAACLGQRHGFVSPPRAAPPEKVRPMRPRLLTLTLNPAIDLASTASRI